MLKNGFALFKMFIVSIDYGWKITNKRSPQNYSPEMEKIKKVLHSDNGEVKS